MKTEITLTILLLSTLWSSAMSRWEALGMLETGNCDICIGPAGEVSRYQIMPFLWKRYAWDQHGYTNAAFAMMIGQTIIYDRIKIYESMITAKGEKPKPITDEQFAMLWHCPGRFFNPTSSDLDYARRFANLVQKDEIEKKGAR
jgi:hypothetical protein